MDDIIIFHSLDEEQLSRIVDIQLDRLNKRLAQQRLTLEVDKSAKKLLASRRQPLRNPDIATAFKAGGLILQSAEPANTVGSVLTRRFHEVGDIVEVGHTMRFGHVRGRSSRTAPALGQDTLRILRELGKSDAEMEALISSGAVYAPPATILQPSATTA